MAGSAGGAGAAGAGGIGAAGALGLASSGAGFLSRLFGRKPEEPKRRQRISPSFGPGLDAAQEVRGMMGRPVRVLRSSNAMGLPPQFHQAFMPR